MTELIVTRGLPGSGKTTWAKTWVARDEEHRARVNRDDLRQNLYGKDAPLPWELEKALSVAQHAAVRALLGAGTSVVVDDTHLRAKYITTWRGIAAECGAVFVVADEFLKVDVETCIRRCHARAHEGGRDVSENVIRDMAERFKNAARNEPTEHVEAPAVWSPSGWERNASAQGAWIVDIDGTLAEKGDRGPFDLTRVSEDTPRDVVIEAVNALHADGARIVILSGREDSCEADTRAWLYKHLGWAWTNSYRESSDTAPLYMRKTGDNRNDALVKWEMFRDQVAKRYNVRGVLDDRDRVVKMWREIGLDCFQVAPGNF